MKKLLLFTGAFILTAAAFAQKGPSTKGIVRPATFRHSDLLSASQKTTGVGDTFAVRHYSTADTPALYVPDQVTPLDSGFTAGTNAWGDKGFAERFEINGNDSSVKILGVIAYFVGSSTASSTKTINLKAWSQGSITPVAGNVYMGGKPDAELASQALNLKDLRMADGTIDTFGTWWFNSPSAAIGDSFFVGYTIDYTWAGLAGDTVALLQTTDGERTTPFFYVNGSDTILNVQNATQFADGSWNDNFFQNTPSLANDYYILAIFSVENPLGVHGVTRNNLEFFGNYPNPATNNTNIRFSLSKSDNVTVTIMDMSGRTINTISKNGLGTGEHIIEVETSNLAAGSYLYTIRTGSGDGMASKFSVVK